LRGTEQNGKNRSKVSAEIQVFVSKKPIDPRIFAALAERPVEIALNPLPWAVEVSIDNSAARRLSKLQENDTERQVASFVV